MSLRGFEIEEKILVKSSIITKRVLLTKYSNILMKHLMTFIYYINYLQEEGRPLYFLKWSDNT